MHNDFVHLVLTRFNTEVPYAPPGRRLDTEWLKARLVPFEKYCLPSIVGQRSVEFRWIIFVDSQSPVWFKEKIESIGPLAKVIYVGEPLTDALTATSIAATGIVNSPYLVTTRIDSDDALGSDHLVKVQRAFRHQDREFLAFPFGLQSYRGHLYNIYWPSNPFISLIEKVQAGNHFTTVHCVRHDLIHDTGMVKRIISTPQWLQVIHNENNQSGLRGLPRLQSRSHPDFNLRYPETPRDDSLVTRLRFSLDGNCAVVNRFIKKVRDGRQSILRGL